MSGPFKMKGWSPFTKNSPAKQKTHPKHPVTPPTKGESKKSKGTLKEHQIIPGPPKGHTWKGTKYIYDKDGNIIGEEKVKK